MTVVSYYPGCSLEATARDYHESLAGCAELMGVELRELPDWNCCGASAAHGIDHAMALKLGQRNLALAQGAPQPVLVPCPLCHNRLRHAQLELAAAGGSTGEDARLVPFDVYFAEPARLAEMAALRKLPLKGLKAACYYGCQGQRPPHVTGSREPENPLHLERILAALGAETVDWDGKTDCCGASHTVPHPEVVAELTGRLFEGALAAGANCLVTACQMCQANLDLPQAKVAMAMGRDFALPVFYYSELIGLALGHPDARKWLRRHLVNPQPLLDAAGLAARA